VEPRSFIAVDWGTTTLRAYLCNESGQPLASCKLNAGIQIRQGSFEDTLGEAIAGLPGSGSAPVLMAGMIGSRQGWLEAAYVETPCDVARLALYLTDVPNTLGRVIKIVPGLADLSGPAPDVMRGEETQLLGLLQRQPRRFATVCMPGTHCKWVHLSATEILSFQTFMTGEIFQLLCAHSILSRLMETGEDHDVWPSFDRGLDMGGVPGHLLQQIFSARTLCLFDRLPAPDIRPYLSGLLIGHEVRAAATAIAGPVALVGDRRLTAFYERALARLGIAQERIADDIAVDGLAVLARAAGLL
jgi:2-dehydro-3-deoxygalactonokinase